MHSPDIALLEATIFNFLKRQTSITSIATLSAMHPANKEELKGKGRVVFGYLNDIIEGLTISTAIAQPSFQFACYDFTYANARRLQQTVRDALESYNSSDIAMVGQRVTYSFRENSSGAFYSEITGLFVASVEFRFNLSLY